MSMIKLENICAGYTKENIIENISVEIDEGQLVGVLGVNGSGKSTLAKTVCNILPHTGKVIIDGCVIEEKKISQIANIISYVPQHSGISIDISVLDVVMMGFNSRLKLLQNPNEKMERQARTVIELLGLGDKADTNFMLLSEGQKQLTIIARALVSDGKLLVMDEPESALDFNVRYRTVKTIKDWVGNGHRAGLVILHDVMLALNNCDKLILLKDKTIADVVDLRGDTIETIEAKLKMIYGEIKLSKVDGKNGKDIIVMVLDSEDI